MTQPLVIAVILNTNKRDDTLACLASLSCQTYDHLKIIVLDNASTDGSNEAIRAAYPQAQILSLTKNLGYAGNNNVGIQAAMQQGAEWIFVLNEDIVLAEDAVARLVEQVERDPKIGIAGPMVYHFDQAQVIQSAGGVMDGWWRATHRGINQPEHGQYERPEPVDWISGCAILVRRAVVESLGMLDERFFYYFEETEWCLRTKTNGWKIWFVPQSKIWHKGVQVNYQPGPNVTYYATRNRLLLFAKHQAPLRAWVYALLVENLRPLLSWTLRPKWRSMRDHRDAMWQGLSDFAVKRWGMRVVSNRPRASKPA
jgi:GT2 family glycosyltransferase